MSGPALRPLALRLAAFSALAGFTALQWAALLEHAPSVRALLAALAISCGAAGLAWIGARRAPGAGAVAAAAGIALASALLAAVALGLPPRLLAPANWDDLARHLGDGISALGAADYPYGGGDRWARLAVLLGLPLLLGLAALLAFWPGRRHQAGLRVAALVLVVGAYGYAATLSPPGLPFIQGLVLLALIGAWLWLPALRRGDALLAAAVLLGAGLASLPLASRLDAADPLIDWTGWDWSAESSARAEAFSWDHTYGPLDWTRTGRTLLEVRSSQPHYWRTVTLDRFDGLRWSSSQQTGGVPLDLPTGVEPRPPPLNQRWEHLIGVRVGDLSSQYLVGAGSVLGLTGGVQIQQTDNGVLLAPGFALEPGDTYRARVYTPDPTAAQMRASEGAYPRVLRHFTTIGVPTHGSFVPGHAGLATAPGTEGRPPVSVTTVERLTVPLRGPGPAPAPAFVSRRLAASPYAGVYRLTRRIAGDSPTAYDAAVAVERYLRRGGFVYDEAPPERRYALRAFLLRDRRGYCQQFSGAMALMLRMAGIPARVASGFSPGVRAGGRYVVTDFDAHSWVEVYFRRIGWVPFDPTPGAAPASSGDVAAGSGAALPEAALTKSKGPAPLGLRTETPGRAAARATEGSSNPLPLLTAAGAAAALALLAAGWVLLRARRHRALSPPQRSEALARELHSGLARLRRAPGTGATLLSIERGLRTLRGEAVAGYAAGLRASRYAEEAPDPPAPAERRRVRRALSGGRGLRARVLGFISFPPGGPRP
jgi:Transglutaminase-like superfamily/TgpA N-terminal domain